MSEVLLVTLLGFAGTALGFTANLLVLIRVGRENKAQIGENATKIGEVHGLVNARMDQALKRIGELERQLAAANVLTRSQTVATPFGLAAALAQAHEATARTEPDAPRPPASTGDSTRQEGAP